MFKLLNSFWHEPAAPHIPDGRDWLLVGIAVALTLIEGFFREDLVMRPLATGLTITMLLSLAWRRTHPFLMVLLAFGLNVIVQNTARFLELAWTDYFTTILLMILPYSLFRWASGRQAFAGLGFIYVTYGLTVGLNNTPTGELLAGILFLMFGAALGATARYRDATVRREKQQVRLREREQLARELHDTVAHHVSAIAIQAQAGRTLAAKRPEAPFEALKIIEEAASKTLSEMRRIVRVMRSEGQPDFSPAASIMDIERLALDSSCPLEIDVSLSGDLNELDTALVSTLYRLTQESITNAVRHANGAKKLFVRIAGDTEQIHLTVEDDGNFVGGQPPSGLGLQGMAERTALLGGSISAGPGEQRGWTIEASLPRSGNAS